MLRSVNGLVVFVGTAEGGCLDGGRFTGCVGLRGFKPDGGGVWPKLLTRFVLSSCERFGGEPVANRNLRKVGRRRID